MWIIVALVAGLLVGFFVGRRTAKPSSGSDSSSGGVTEPASERVLPGSTGGGSGTRFNKL